MYFLNVGVNGLSTTRKEPLGTQFETTPPFLPRSLPQLWFDSPVFWACVQYQFTSWGEHTKTCMSSTTGSTKSSKVPERTLGQGRERCHRGGKRWRRVGGKGSAKWNLWVCVLCSVPFTCRLVCSFLCGREINNFCMRAWRLHGMGARVVSVYIDRARGVSIYINRARGVSIYWARAWCFCMLSARVVLPSVDRGRGVSTYWARAWCFYILGACGVFLYIGRVRGVYILSAPVFICLCAECACGVSSA